jgi:hypothetical protein
MILMLNKLIYTACSPVGGGHYSTVPRMAAATQSLSFEAQSLSLGGHLNGSKQRPQELISGACNSWSYDSLSLPLSKLGTPARVYVYILLLLLLFALTYITTSLHFKATRWSKSKGKTVPLVPYSIPVIGHAMAFAFSVAGLIQDNMYVKFSPAKDIVRS